MSDHISKELFIAHEFIFCNKHKNPVYYRHFHDNNGLLYTITITLIDITANIDIIFYSSYKKLWMYPKNKASVYVFSYRLNEKVIDIPQLLKDTKNLYNLIC